MSASPLASTPRASRYAGETAMTIGEASAHKPLGKFGCASIRRPVSEAIARANAEDAAVGRGRS